MQNTNKMYTQTIEIRAFYNVYYDNLHSEKGGNNAENKYVEKSE